MKLQNKRGASAVLAMAVFLIAALLSFAIVNSALTGMHAANSRNVDEQAYLSASSASQLVRRAVEEAKVTVTNEDGDPAPEPIYAGDNDKPMDKALLALVKAKGSGTTMEPPKVSFTVAYPNSPAEADAAAFAEAAQRVEEVTAKLTLGSSQGDYTLTAQLVPADGGARVTLVFRGEAVTTPKMEDDDSGNITQTGTETTITWVLDTVR